MSEVIVISSEITVAWQVAVNAIDFHVTEQEGTFQTGRK